VQTVTQLASSALSADLNFMNLLQTNENDEEFWVITAVKLNNKVFWEQVVPDIPKDCSAFIFQADQFILSPLCYITTPSRSQLQLNCNNDPSGPKPFPSHTPKNSPFSRPHQYSQAPPTPPISPLPSQVICYLQPLYDSTLFSVD